MSRFSNLITVKDGNVIRYIRKPAAERTSRSRFASIHKTITPVDYCIKETVDFGYKRLA